jgi:Prenyltransferase and squalene oxidase repeat
VESSGLASRHPLCSGKEHIMRAPTRLTAYAATVTLALAGSLLTITPAEAAVHDDVGQTAAANWLEDELTDGVVHNDQFNFDDVGLTADFAFGLDAVGGHDATVQGIVDTIEPRAEDEWYTSTYEGITTTYGGSVAKLLALVQQTGGTPTSFGGENLVTLLQSLVADAAPIAGRVQNQNDSFGDANTIGQALAANGLDQAGSSEAANASAFLLKQQCSSGYFRLNFTADKAAPEQTCVNNTDEPDTDATAIAVLQLREMSVTAARTTAITDAVNWLLTQQRDDGSWGGGPTTEGSNANSTGLAAWALGDRTESEEAAQWLRDHQATPLDMCNRLGGFDGAISYDDAARSTGRSEGITVESSDQWRRATAQAVFALEYLPEEPSAALTLTGPSGFRKAGGQPVLSTSGAPAGTQLCLTGVGTRLRRTPTTDPWNATVTLPAGTANRVYTVRDAYDNVDTATVKVLGRTTLDVRTSDFRRPRSSQVTAVVRGLVAGERASVYYKGNLVKSGIATSLGRFAATFNVGSALGTQNVVGYGQFRDIRNGTTQIRVVP